MIGSGSLTFHVYLLILHPLNAYTLDLLQFLIFNFWIHKPLSVGVLGLHVLVLPPLPVAPLILLTAAACPFNFSCYQFFFISSLPRLIDPLHPLCDHTLRTHVPHLHVVPRPHSRAASSSAL